MAESHESINVSEYAALLIHSARRGRQRQMFFTRSAHKSFKLRHRVIPISFSCDLLQFGWIFLGASWSLFFLSFFCRPTWTYQNSGSKYDQQELYPTANIPTISARGSAVISLFLTVIVTIGVLLEVKYMSQHEIISTDLEKLCQSQGFHGDKSRGSVSNDRGSDPGERLRRTLSKRSLSLGSEREGSFIQISTRDPNPIHSSSTPQNLLTKISKFMERNFLKTNYFLSLSIKRFFRIIFIVLNIIDICFLVSFLIQDDQITATTPSQLERYSSWLCIVYIFWFDYQSAANLYILLSSMKRYFILPSFDSSIPRFTIILLLFGIFVVACACIGTFDYHLNEYSIHEDDSLDPNISHSNYFSSFSKSLWTVLTSISTTSLPTQILPYYCDSRLTFIYFFFYLTIGNFFFLNLVLVFVMAEYQNSFQHSQHSKSTLRNANLQMAFHVLDVYQRGYLSYTQVYDLLQEVYRSYPEFRGGYWHEKTPSSSEIAVLVAALDINGDNFIYEEQFMWILHLTQIIIEEKVKPLLQLHSFELGPRSLS